jgi:phospholipid transport system substrate-binding protein
MTQLPRRHLLGIAFAGLLAAPAAWAQAGDPAAPIKTLNDALLHIMQMGGSASFADRVKVAGPPIQAAFDLPQILKISVGSRWGGLPPAQQTRLLEVFTRYTVDSYVANFSGFSGQKFVILPESRNIGADKTVETQIVPISGDSNRIDYVMRQGGGGWKAVDVLLDGSISRVAVQRSDFRSLLSEGDASRLISTLGQKAAVLESGNQP